MARAAAKGGKRTRPDARSRQQRPAGKGPGRQKLSQSEQTLLFVRIRRQAKWAFIVMVLVFGVSFAVAGVGSGNGVNPFQGLFNPGGGSSTSVSSLEKKVKEHPRDAQAWHDLGLAYAAKSDKMDQAVSALTRYTQLRPKDPVGYADLAQIQTQQASTLTNQWQFLQAQYAALQSGSTSPVTLTGKLAQAAGSSPVAQAVQSQAQQAYSAASSVQAGARSAYLGAIASFKKVEKLRPADPEPPTDIAAAARSAYVGLGYDPSFLKPMIVSYERLEKLDPANAKQYRSQVEQLKRLQTPAHG